MRKLFTTVLFTAFIFVSCQEDLTTQMKMGPMKDEAILNANPAITLRSPKSAEGVVNVLVTEGAGFASERIFATASRPVDLTQTIVIKGDTTLVEAYRIKTGVDYIAMPDAFYAFDSSRTLEMSQGTMESSSTVLKIYATNPVGNQLEPGRYLLPVIASSSLGEVSSTLYYDIVVREPFEGDAELYEGDDAFFIFYINTEYYDPRLVTDYYMTAMDMMSTETVWYNTVGNIVNLRRSTIIPNENGKAILQLGADIRYVLDHTSKYLYPLQESGRKVCLSIEGGNKGLGFCNMSDAQISDFTRQVKQIVDYYNLDGINLWDRNSGYDLDNAAPMTTTSYPKLIKSLRNTLGSDKLLTLTDYEEPTAYFWDSEATGGIVVGEYLDYAWSGYCDRDEGYQIIDPYHQDTEEVSSLHPRKPILGLDASRYGCINAPWATNSVNVANETQSKFLQWSKKGLNPNYFCVYEDLRTNLQDNLEGRWGLYELLYLYHFYEMKCIYLDDQSRLWQGTKTGYNKWLKDW